MYSKYVVGPTEHVEQRVKEIEDGKFDERLLN